MKMLRIVAALALSLVASSAVAQWQTPNHTIPVGRGVGKTGFGSVPVGPAGLPLISTGLTLDPTFGQATNAGIFPGTSNTLKGTTDGISTADVAVPNCTILTSALRWASGSGFSCGTVVGVTGFDMPINAGLSAAVASTSLTLTLTQASGSAPTAGSPVVVPFRSTTLTSGAVTTGTINSTISITIPSGATLGTSSSNVPFRIWIFVDNNGGTPALSVATCSTSTTVFPCTSWETSLKTTTTIGAGSTAAGTLYATAGLASDSVRIVGYCDYATGLATAGSWVSACTTLQVMGPGTKKPGDVVQELYSSTGTNSSTANSYALSNTAPVAGNGGNAINLTVTPTSPVNAITVNAQAVVGNGTAGATSMAAYLMTGATVNVASSLGVESSGTLQTLPIFYRTTNIGATTFGLYYTGSAAGTAINGTNGVPYLGGTGSTFMRIQEIMGALPEPANDNINPGLFSATG